MLFAREIRVPRRPVSRVVVARLDGLDYFLTNSVKPESTEAMGAGVDTRDDG